MVLMQTWLSLATKEDFNRWTLYEKTARPDYPFVLFEKIEPRLDTSALIQGIIKPESFVVTYGESGSGKTFDALHRDLCIASGNDYFGRYADKGLVVYLAAEGGDSTSNRVYAYRRELFPSASFVLVPYSMDLLTTGGDVEGVIRLVNELESLTGEKCVKVTQDTLARAMAGGNENSSEDMGALVAKPQNPGLVQCVSCENFAGWGLCAVGLGDFGGELFPRIWGKCDSYIPTEPAGACSDCRHLVRRVCIVSGFPVTQLDSPTSCHKYCAK